MQLPNENIYMTPEYFYIIPGYLRFAAIAENPFEQFYIHFNLSDRLKNPQQIFTVDADTDTVKLIKELVCRGNGIKNQQLTMLSAAYILTSTLLQLPAEVM